MATKTKKKPAAKPVAKKAKAKTSQKSARMRSAKPSPNGHHSEATTQTDPAPPSVPATDLAPSPTLASQVANPADDIADKEIAKTHEEAAKVVAAADKAVATLEMTPADFARLLELRQVAREKDRKLKKVTEDQKAAKKAAEVANNEVTSFLDEFVDPRPILKHCEAAQEAKAAKEPKTIVVDTEAWRHDPIDVLADEAIVGDKAISEAILANLRKVEILTMGNLQNWTDTSKNGGYERRLTDIGGIGKAADEKIGEATIAYWEWQKRKPPATPVEATESRTPAEASPPADDVNAPSLARCPHCEAELVDTKPIKCPGCNRDGCGNCMPGGAENNCPQCEAGDGKSDDREDEPPAAEGSDRSGKGEGEELSEDQGE